MCVINFNIATTGTSPIAAEGRYRNMNLPSITWVNFSINLLDQKTPDILVNGSYGMQVRVQYPDSSFSDWTDTSLFTVGNCTQAGNLYSLEGCASTKSDFDIVLFSDSTKSGNACYVPEIGDTLYKDNGLTIPADPGVYAIYGKFNLCFTFNITITVDATGKVINNQYCEPEV